MTGQVICECCGAVAELIDLVDADWEIVGYNDDGSAVRICPSCAENINRVVKEDR